MRTKQTLDLQVDDLIYIEHKVKCLSRYEMIYNIEKVNDETLYLTDKSNLMINKKLKLVRGYDEFEKRWEYYDTLKITNVWRLDKETSDFVNIYKRKRK